VLSSEMKSSTRPSSGCALRSAGKEIATVSGAWSPPLRQPASAIATASTSGAARWSTLQARRWFWGEAVVRHS